MSKKRDSAYFKARLKRDHPAVHAALVGGRHPSVRAAAAAAGLIRLPTHLDALKREWKAASSTEQKEFVHWVAARRALAGSPRPIADPKGILTPAVRDFLVDWIAGHKSKPGRIMKQIGFSGFDWTLAHAIYEKGQLRKEAIDKLGPWLTRNGFRSR